MAWNPRNSDNFVKDLIEFDPQTSSRADVLLLGKPNQTNRDNIAPDDLYWCAQKIDGVLENMKIQYQHSLSATEKSEDDKQLANNATELQLIRNEMMHVYKTMRYFDFQIHAVECEIKERLSFLRDLKDEEKYYMVILCENKKTVAKIRQQQFREQMRHRKRKSHQTKMSSPFCSAVATFPSMTMEVGTQVTPSPTLSSRSSFSTTGMPLQPIREHVLSFDNVAIANVEHTVQTQADFISQLAMSRLIPMSSGRRKKLKRRKAVANRNAATISIPQDIVLLLSPVTPEPEATSSNALVSVATTSYPSMNSLE